MPGLSVAFYASKVGQKSGQTFGPSYEQFSFFLYVPVCFRFQISQRITHIPPASCHEILVYE